MSCQVKLVYKNELWELLWQALYQQRKSTEGTGRQTDKQRQLYTLPRGGNNQAMIEQYDIIQE